MNSIQKENPLGYEKLPRLLKSFAVPSIIAMLVSSLYNIVDQVFIGQGVGYLGNAATNVAFPLTTISLAIALLIGIGSASLFSLNLGAGEKEDAVQVVGTAFTMMLVFGVIYAVLIEIFLVPLLTAFGATAEIMPYAKEYTRITAIGMPFLIVNNGMSNLARADGSPKFSMTCMLIGAIINTILDPVFIFIFKLGVAGAAWATIIGQIVSCLVAVSYLKRFRNVELKAHYFRLHRKLCLKIASLGMSNSLNQVALTFVQIVLNNSLTYYGALSPYGKEIPLAACGIVMKTNAILLAVIIGISQGSQPIIGFNGVQLLSSNFFAAIGKPVKGMLLSLTRQVFFLIPLLFILPLFLGIDGIMYAGPVADAIAFLTSVFLISREMKKMKLAEIAK